MSYADKLKRLHERTAQRREYNITAMESMLKDSLLGQVAPDTVASLNVKQMASDVTNAVNVFKSVIKARGIDQNYSMPLMCRKFAKHVQLFDDKDLSEVPEQELIEAVALHLQENPSDWDEYDYFNPDAYLRRYE